MQKELLSVVKSVVIVAVGVLVANEITKRFLSGRVKAVALSE